jgi:hypothetical protein
MVQQFFAFVSSTTPKPRIRPRQREPPRPRPSPMLRPRHWFSSFSLSFHTRLQDLHQDLHIDQDQDLDQKSDKDQDPDLELDLSKRIGFACFRTCFFHSSTVITTKFPIRLTHSDFHNIMQYIILSTKILLKSIPHQINFFCE